MWLVLNILLRLLFRLLRMEQYQIIILSVFPFIGMIFGYMFRFYNKQEHEEGEKYFKVLGKLLLLILIFIASSEISNNAALALTASMLFALIFLNINVKLSIPLFLIIFLINKNSLFLANLFLLSLFEGNMIEKWKSSFILWTAFAIPLIYFIFLFTT